VANPVQEDNRVAAICCNKFNAWTQLHDCFCLACYECLASVLGYAQLRAATIGETKSRP
jgi:hypothetical protein